MIQDVDDTLRELLVQKGSIDPTMVDIRFELPNKEWAATLTKPTLDLFLYDVRENRELRTSQRTLTSSPDGTTNTLTRAPVRMDLSYLVTAWTTEVADEHQLLGGVLTTLLRFPLLPAEVLKGSLVAQPLPVQAWIAQPDRIPNAWEFWGHVDHGMKAGLNFVVTAAVLPFTGEDVSLATMTIINVGPK